MSKGKGVFVFCFLLGLVNQLVQGSPQNDPSRRRVDMVRTQLEERDITDARVLEAMRSVPRHLFVPERLRSWAYADHPLPIGDGQTISQPYIVALMTQLLDLRPGEKVLEIGTGSGYQAAVLAHLTDRVYSIEIKPELARNAERRLKGLGYETIQLRSGDGYAGWKEHAPYDAIIITCAAPEVPAVLLQQLREGGRIVMPRGDPWGNQILSVITKVKGKPVIDNITAVRFVPMVRGKPPPPEESCASASCGGSLDLESMAFYGRPERVPPWFIQGLDRPIEGLLLQSACANF